jgi:hypothetical protein
MEEEKVGVSSSADATKCSSSVKSEVELVQSRLHSPIIDPDEEINEDDAFNSEDELLYAEFFPRSRSNSINPVGALNNMNNGNTNSASVTMPPQQQMTMNHNITSADNNTPHISINDNNSSSNSRMETRRSAAAASAAAITTSNAEYLVNTNPTVVVENNNTTLRRYSGIGIGQMTTRSRSSSIAMDDHGIIGGSNGGRSRIFSIDFDREYYYFLCSVLTLCGEREKGEVLYLHTIVYIYHFCTLDIIFFS